MNKTNNNQDKPFSTDDRMIESPLENSDANGVIRAAEAPLPTDYGTFTAVVYHDLHDNKEHMLLKMGDVDSGAIVRVHSECLTGDILGSQKCDCGSQLELALKKIGEEGKGALLYMRQEGRGIGLANKICLLYTSPSPRDGLLSRMPSSA